MDAAAPVLQAVSGYLLAAAQWRGQHRDTEPSSPPKMLMAAASRSLDVLALAHHADLAILRATYDPAPASNPQADGQTSTASALPPAPPNTPPAGPAPGR
ncbi:hypothetical protein GPA10_37465 [Streptomyces sp. p1417]|uniref:Uncharacterized protein n=1 Tax=Streptomyces typhae TaxID=2681492 RepID=A0A6L6X9Z7_9ACTN|nr:hypothetical protein [Streptomyces typhae]